MFISPQLDQEVSLLNSIKISRKTAYPFFLIYFMKLKGKLNYQIHALVSVLLWIQSQVKTQQEQK